MMTSYDEECRRWLREAYAIAKASLDPSTQVGAVIISPAGVQLSWGINEFPRGLEYTDERLERPLKYSFIEHAERNAVYRAASIGLRLHEAVMYAPWAACTDCARAIVQSGISRLVRHKDAGDRSPEWWMESIALADEILGAGGVEIMEVEGPIGFDHDFRILHTGESWAP